jgi:phenylpyruvate tautomerase PptA (4-oxalocrotonate tautomerase family)
MPILHLETSLPVPPGALRALADDLGEMFAVEPGHVWVRVLPCEPSLYAENGIDAPAPHVFGRLMLRRHPDEDGLATLAARLTELLVQHIGAPRDDVHLYFEPPVAGRIAFGGALVRSA